MHLHLTVTMGSGYAIVGLLTFLTHSRDNNLDMTQWPAWCWAIHGVEWPLSDMIRVNYMIFDLYIIHCTLYPIICHN